MRKLYPKISIIGAGNVGTRYAYALTIRGLAREIVIVDIDREKLEGEVMDLSHGAPYTSPVEIIAGQYSDIEKSDLVVITAGKNQEKDETRIDLVDKNTKLFKKIVPKIVKNAPNAKILVVTNPVDILSYVTYKISGKPTGEVFGSGTTLDTARFRFLLAQHFNVNARNVHAYILGEHGDTEFPVWSSAMIGGSLISEYSEISECDDSKIVKDNLSKIFERVRDSAYKIIDRKGETSYGIGLAMARITQAIVNDENTILPVSTYIDDYCDVSDVFLSIPCVLNRDGIRHNLKISMNEEEISNFKNSAEAMKDIINQIEL